MAISLILNVVIVLPKMFVACAPLSTRHFSWVQCSLSSTLKVEVVQVAVKICWFWGGANRAHCFFCGRPKGHIRAPKGHSALARTLPLTYVPTEYYFQEQHIVCNNETRPQFHLFSSLLLPQRGQTALMRASQNGHYNVVEKLLSAGAQPDIQDKVTLLVTMVMLIQVPNELL